MPRKTKEQNELEKEKVVKSTPKKSSKSTKSTTAKKSTTKKETKPKAEISQKSKTTKTAAKKKDEKSTTKKTTTPKKEVSKKTSKTPKSTNKKAKNSKTDVKKSAIVEYYDLPYRYNQTIVKVLYQTPKTLFIYWDISDDDRKVFEEQYGEDFFQTTRPVLIVHNNTLGYSFEVEINDFANSWYLNVSDSKCDYKVELGRRPIVKTEKIASDYIHISISNEIESPNDQILFDNNQKMVYFRNVKTGSHFGKSVNSISFIRNMGKIYNIYDLYKAIYANENVEDIYDLSNPSS